MRRKLMLALLAIGATGLGGFAAIGLAGGDGGTPAAKRLVSGYDSPGVAVHRVAEPTVGARATAFERARARQVRIAYFETDPFPIADGEALGESLPCPGNRRVLDGYFGSDGTDVALTFSAPESNRRWFVGVTNLAGIDPPATQAFAGIVCAKGAK